MARGLHRQRWQAPGTVEAPDERTAIAEAAKLFNITAARRFKIVVTKIDDKRKRPG
jgi:1,2-phenylacetyl-CoA epoxidase PaaB subunit